MSLQAETIELDATFNSLKELKHMVKRLAIKNNFETHTTDINSVARLTAAPGFYMPVQLENQLFGEWFAFNQITIVWA